MPASQLYSSWQAQQDDSNAQQAADAMSSLIPEYRSTLARMKKQVDELQLRLEDACQERHSLHQQVGRLLIFYTHLVMTLLQLPNRSS